MSLFIRPEERNTFYTGVRFLLPRQLLRIARRYRFVERLALRSYPQPLRWILELLPSIQGALAARRQVVQLT